MAKSYGNDEIQYLVMKVFHPLVIHKVQSTDILPYLTTIIDRHEISEIRSMHEQGRIRDATIKLLSVIDESTEMGKWRCFMEALEKAEYLAVYNVLKGDITEGCLDDEHKEKLISLFNEKLVLELDLTDSQILIYLFEKKVINTSDMQKINAKVSDTDKVLELLNHISRRHPNWFESFLDSLLRDNKSELVELIDPKSLAKKTKLQECENVPTKLQVSEDDSMEVPVMEGEGDAYESGNYASNILSGKTFESLTEAKLFDKGMLSNTIKENSSHKPYEKERKQLNTEKLKMNIEHDEREPESIEVDHHELCKDALSIPEGSESIEVHHHNDIELKPIELRPYQEELCKDALSGKNVIICAPTGSGKTIVAVNIIKEHFKNGNGIKKVAFLVNQVALAEQQFNLCKEYLNCRIERITGDIQMTTKISLSKLLEMNDVLVMTAQILVDAIKERHIKDVTAFSMIVFDECHHAKARHPYNQIMHLYMDVKFNCPVIDGVKHKYDELPARPLPQVIGLTASVGVGKAKREVEAKDHIIDLCANLDVKKICQVSRDHEADMQEFVSVPVLNIETAPMKTNDVYHQTVVEIMNKIENDMLKSDYLKDPDEELKEFCTLLKAPANKKHDSYTQWLSRLWKGINKVNEIKARKFYVTCHKMLEIFHSALIINSDCRSIDSYYYIEEEFSKRITPNQSPKDHETLKKYYSDKKQKLLAICNDPNNVNPKLEKLKKMIVDGFAVKPDSRAIVFAKTLALVHKLKVWMDETPELQDLNLKPKTVTGARATVEKGGMTRNQQVEVLECFKSGDSKLIIATSVAEEGLDIKKCNLVIRYDHVTNEIAMVQSRGRARAANSGFKLVTSQESNSAKKEELNLSRELMMKRALIELEKMEPQTLDEIIEKKQKQMKVARETDRVVREGRLLSPDEFVLRCFGCTTFACLSSDVRTIRDSQFTVIDEDFKERYVTKVHPSPVEFHGFQKKNKIYCKECMGDWGIEAIHRNVTFPLIKISSFTIEDRDGKKTTASKWKKAPFRIESLEDEYFEREFMEASGNSLRDGYDSADDN